MRLIKLDKLPHNKTTWPALVLSQVLLDIRNMCSNYENYKPRSNISRKIYNYLKEIDKTHIFNVSNFDPNLLSQCRDNIRLRSTKPSYIVYNHLERLELEQAKILAKFNVPVYPENEKLYYEQLLIQKLNQIQTKRGDKFARTKSFNWE